MPEFLTDEDYYNNDPTWSDNTSLEPVIIKSPIPKKKDNTLLYVGLGFVALLLLSQSK